MPTSFEVSSVTSFGLLTAEPTPGGQAAAAAATQLAGGEVFLDLFLAAGMTAPAPKNVMPPAAAVRSVVRAPGPVAELPPPAGRPQVTAVAEGPYPGAAQDGAEQPDIGDAEAAPAAPEERRHHDLADPADQAAVLQIVPPPVPPTAEVSDTGEASGPVAAVRPGETGGAWLAAGTAADSAMPVAARLSDPGRDEARTADLQPPSGSTRVPEADAESNNAVGATAGRPIEREGKRAVPVSGQDGKAETQEGPAVRADVPAAPAGGTAAAEGPPPPPPPAAAAATLSPPTPRPVAAGNQGPAASISRADSALSGTPAEADLRPVQPAAPPAAAPPAKGESPTEPRRPAGSAAATPATTDKISAAPPVQPVAAPAATQTPAGPLPPGSRAAAPGGARTEARPVPATPTPPAIRPRTQPDAPAETPAETQAETRAETAARQSLSLDSPGADAGLSPFAPATVGGSNPSPPPAIAAPAPPAHPGFAVRQLADAVTGAQGGAIEIRLSPEELGHVKLSLHHGDGGLTVQIAAERPETLDLIRRHLPELDRSLRDLGHQSLGFSFADSRGDRPPAAQDARPSRATDETEGARAAPVIARPSASDPRAGLDLRL